jgi:transcriptional regulator with XRE-family HTH domain
VKRRGHGDRRGSDEFDRTIGSRLRRERWLSGTSRDELGRALGVSGEIVRAYECGEKRVPPERLLAATSALVVPMMLLFYRDDRYAPSVADEDMDLCPTLAIGRPLVFLERPGFAQARSIVTQWRELRGKLTDDVHRTVLTAGLLPRTTLLRQVSASRLVIEHLGAGIAILRPCETLLAIGRGFEDMPDRNYGGWVAQAYDEVLWSGAVRVESVRASVRTSATTTLRTRYDRVLMPWRGKGDEMYVMGLSIRRESPKQMA